MASWSKGGESSVHQDAIDLSIFKNGLGQTTVNRELAFDAKRRSFQDISLQFKFNRMHIKTTTGPGTQRELCTIMHSNIVFCEQTNMQFAETYTITNVLNSSSVVHATHLKNGK